MNQPCSNLGSFFQFPDPRQEHLRPNWLRTAKTGPAPNFGFVFSNPPLRPSKPLPMGSFFQIPHLVTRITSKRKNAPDPSHPLASFFQNHPLPNLGSFFQPSPPRPNWLRSVIRTHIPHSPPHPSPSLRFRFAKSPIPPPQAAFLCCHIYRRPVTLAVC